MNCPKCNSTSIWVETQGMSDFLRCKCGLMALVKQTKNGYVIKTGIPGVPSVAPRRGTPQHKVLMAVASRLESSTSEISEMAECKQDHAMQQLRVLEVARLVQIVTQGKGRVGGHVWSLTPRAEKLLGV